jgi:hypothetical protein
VKFGGYNRAASRFHREDKDIDAMARQVVSNYLKNIELVHMLADRYGFEYAFFWQPIIFASHKALTVEEQHIRTNEGAASPGLESLVQQTYQRVQEQNRTNLYYIADAFNDTSESIYIDSHHVSTQGNRLVAQRMYRIVKGRGL